MHVWHTTHENNEEVDINDKSVYFFKDPILSKSNLLLTVQKKKECIFRFKAYETSIWSKFRT